MWPAGRPTGKFQFLVERSCEAYRRCRKAYIDAGGERLLGPVPGPEELESVRSAGTLPHDRRSAPETTSPAGERAAFNASQRPSDQAPPSTPAA